eukprot:TRINITY_DN18837_c0_g1_i1.p1 TRINITY_DN18837_c0_g1~~TRINITY_DN18837_c0_g1_i1.p1  ORF type:complete len:676 (-),score=176.02 TRINITY_DN18837_c0_g1_i1:229-2256(-)
MPGHWPSSRRACLVLFAVIAVTLSEAQKIDRAPKTQKIGKRNVDEDNPTEGKRVVIVTDEATIDVTESEEVSELLDEIYAGAPEVIADPDSASGADGGQMSEVERLMEQAVGLINSTLPEERNYAQAIRLFEQAAAAGSDDALFNLGELYEAGDLLAGFQPNMERAVQYFQRAADKGNPAAQQTLGYLYATGLGVEQDDALSLLYYTFAARGDDTFAQLSLGFNYMHGYGVTKSCNTAINHYSSVADKVVKSIQEPGVSPVVDKTRLSEEADSLNQKEEDQDIVNYYKYSAAKGDVHAQVALGHLNYYGARGLPQNAEAAVTFFRQAAQQGDASAMAQMGMMYAQGVGVDKSNETALYYFRKGADKGHAAALTGLGHMYAHGSGVTQDNEKAFKYFTQAADKGNAEGQFNLGAMYIGGLGVKQDNQQALHYFTRAAHQGHTLALYNLGVMYLFGMGTPRSCPTAVQFMKSVAERGPWSSLLQDGHTLYKEGDMQGALSIYSKGAEMGYELAQANSAHILETDREMGFGQDLRMARLYSRSAAQGHVESKVKLGDAYFYGRGVKADPRQASLLYRQGSDHRDARASFNLGYMHHFGAGAPRDLHLAKRYYDIAITHAAEAEAPTRIMLYLLKWQLFIEEHGYGDLVDTYAVDAGIGLCASIILLLFYKRRARLQAE